MARSVVLGVVVAMYGIGGWTAQAQSVGGTAFQVVETRRATHDGDLDVAPRRGGDRRAPWAFPYTLVSSSHLLASLEKLTAIGAHAGWRSCGSRGESEARNLVAAELAGFKFLGALGMDVERRSFRTIAGMEMWESRVDVAVDGRTIEVPADALTGDPYRVWRAMSFDSDGDLTDLESDPMIATGPPLAVRTVADIAALRPETVAGRVVVLDFALIDRTIVPPAEAYDRVAAIATSGPAGLLAVTTMSNAIGASHGTFAGDGSMLIYAQTDPPMPILFCRLEDVESSGIDGWAGLTSAATVRLTWDADIVTPGESGNVVAHIPGVDREHAVILSAHLDSPNSPGALDNGSGSVSLLEVARVLDAARLRPPTDLYLVWFGCHERGMHGSPRFAAHHQEVLDRALAVVELDAMARPLDGITETINLESRSYRLFGDERVPLPEYLRQTVAPLGIDVVTWDVGGILTDVSGFLGYDVPTAVLDNLNIPVMEELGPLHYGAHWHDPYDTMELARDEAAAFEDLTRVMLAAALETGRSASRLRVTPPPSRRAVFVGTHTEAVEMGPTILTDFGMSLAWDGFDVDVIPHGQRLTATDLAEADLVIVLPVLDYANEFGDVDAYDEAWNPSEVDVLEDYVTAGGRLVLTTSGARLWFSNITREYNEDWPDVNAVSARFGVRYVDGLIEGDHAVVASQHDLVAGVSSLWTSANASVGLSAPDGAMVLATTSGRPAMVLVESGPGALLALSDLAMLGDGSGEHDNQRFWRNLAAWAVSPRVAIASRAADEP